jgi:F-type H+-transporting ATPase subunit b
MFGLYSRSNRVFLLIFSGSNIQLVPDGTLLFHLALIVAMVGLLNLTLLRPITRILDERERRTRGRAAEAQSILASVSQKLLAYEQRMRDARAGGYALLEQMRTARSREREQKIAEVKTEVNRWLDAEKQELRTDVEKIRGSLEKDARIRALEISRQILGRQVVADGGSVKEQG